MPAISAGMEGITPDAVLARLGMTLLAVLKMTETSSGAVDGAVAFAAADSAVAAVLANRFKPPLNGRST